MPQIDFDEEIAPEIMKILKSRNVYKRFIMEREILERMIKKSFDKTGRLNSPNVLMQDKIVEKLGEEVLLEIRRIEIKLLIDG